MKKYLNNYGILRIIACLLVILHHSINVNVPFCQSTAENTTILIMDNLCMVCNGLFFMMSGKFALRDYETDIFKYYRNKLLHIFLPLCIVQLVGYVLFSKMMYGVSSWRDFLHRFFLSNLCGWHWFMYVLLGFYLCAPLISRMIHSLSRLQKKYFLLLIFLFVCYNTFRECIRPDFYQVEIPFQGYMAYFLLGFLWEEIAFPPKIDLSVLLLGIVFSVVSCYEHVVMPGANPSLLGLCLSRFVMCLGCYILLTKGIERVNSLAQLSAPIRRIASLTYYIYLWHGYFLLWLLNHLPLREFRFAAVFRSFEIFLWSFLLSALTGMLMQLSVRLRKHKQRVI